MRRTRKTGGAEVLSPAPPVAGYKTVLSYLKANYEVSEPELETALTRNPGLGLLLLSCTEKEWADAAGDRIAWRMRWKWKGD